MKIKIVYETQVGTTQFVAEVLQATLQEVGHEVDLHSIRQKGRQPKLEGYDMVLFGSPTYNEGRPEASVEQMIEEFHPDLSQIKVAVFSLGDKSYEAFCGSAEVLENWVKECKGTPVVPALKVDGYPQEVTGIQEWAKSL